MFFKYLFFFFLFHVTLAQESIYYGKVLFDEQPLEGVSVLLKGTSKGTITNKEGIFKINIGKLENQKLVFSFVGYEPILINLNNQDYNIGIVELIPDKSLEEVVISGSLKPVSKLDSPTPVEVYSKTFFNANPTSTVFEALENINGIRPQLNCNICNTGDIHINGQEGSYTMVLIDGLPIVSGLSTVYGFSGIPQFLIERVEIVKGPVSNLYGSEAIGGVINLITKLPENTSTLNVESFVSGWGEVNTDIGIKYRLSNNSSGLLGINYFNYSNPIDKNQDGFTDLTLQDRISIFNKIKIGNKFNIVGRYLYEDRWGGQMNWSREKRGSDQVYGESIFTSRFELFGDYRFNQNFSFQFSYNDHSQNSFYGLLPFNANQTVGFSQFLWSRNIKYHKILIGTSYRYTLYDDSTVATFDEKLSLNKVSRTHLPGIFFQDEIELNTNNIFLMGLRYDYNSLHGNIITPRLNYKLSSNDKSASLRLSFGSGYRVVQVFTEDHAALTGARDVIFLEDLNPERSWNFNINFFKKFYLKQGVLLDLDFSVFNTQFSNKIIPDYDTDPNKIIYNNLNGSSTNQGASVNLNLLTQNGIRLNLGTTFIDSYILENNIKTIPYLTERIRGVWRIEKNWISSNFKLDISGNSTGPLKLPTLGPLDPRPIFSKTFHILNFQLTKSWNNNFESFGGVKNLFNFTPPPNSIARPFDPFDNQVSFDSKGNVISTSNNPYALTFDSSYVFASNQGIRLFFGLRFKYN